MPNSEDVSSSDGATRILVTGANGFVGRHLISELIADHREKLKESKNNESGTVSSIQIFAAVHTEPVGAAFLEKAPSTVVGWMGDNPDDPVQQIELDLDSQKSIVHVLNAAKPHHIYHLAGRASAADTDREKMVLTNSEGVRQLLDAASEIQPFPRTLLISSGYVYGDISPERPAREEDPVGPLWRHGAYVDSKIEMENIARGYRAFAFTARAFAHTGPGQRPAFAIPSFANQLAKIEAGLLPPTLNVGNLEAKRDILDVRDVVRAYRLLMKHAETGNVYNVANGNPVSIQSALDILREACKVKTEVQIDPSRLRAADIQCSSGDTLQTWALTGWTPRFTLVETLSDTLDYWRIQTAAEKNG